MPYYDSLDVKTKILSEITDVKPEQIHYFEKAKEQIQQLDYSNKLTLQNRAVFFNQVKKEFSVNIDQAIDKLFKALIFAMDNDSILVYKHLVEDVLFNIQKLKLSTQDDEKVILQLLYCLSYSGEKYWQHFYKAICYIASESRSVHLKKDIIKLFEDELLKEINNEIRTELNTFIHILRYSIKEA
jgi:hypothetical protein